MKQHINPLKIRFPLFRHEILKTTGLSFLKVTVFCQTSVRHKPYSIQLHSNISRKLHTWLFALSSDIMHAGQVTNTA